MAYFSQEHKAKIAPVIKSICKRYNVKATLAVRNHMTLALNIRQGEIDFVENFIETDSQVAHGGKMTQDQIDNIRRNCSVHVNPYWFHEHFSGQARAFLTEIIAAMKGPDYFDESDIQSDYFHTSHYIEVNIGRWNQPYALVK